MQNAKTALQNKRTKKSKKASKITVLCASAIASINAQQTQAQIAARANINMFTR